MGWIVTCECGAEITGGSDEALVAAADRHRRSRHPALRSAPPRADVLAMAQPHDLPPNIALQPEEGP